MNDRNDLLDWESDLSALYREIPQPVPPADLDERLLQAAQQAVTSVTSPQQKNRRWLLPVAMAAVLVLGVGLVRTMNREVPHSPEPSAMQAPQFESHPGRRSSPAPTNNEPKADLAAPRPAEERPVSQPTSSAGENAAKILEQQRSTPDPAPAPAFLQNQEQNEAERKTGKAEARERLDRQQQSRRDPLEWLREIVALRRQGRNAEAETDLKAFRRQYPDYPLPAISEQPKQP
jgi:hypothetical protein